MQPIPMGEVEAKMRLDVSTSGFADRVPLLSARSLLSRGQRNLFVGLLVVMAAGLLIDVRLTFYGNYRRLHPGLPGSRDLPGVPLLAVLKE